MNVFLQQDDSTSILMFGQVKVLISYPFMPQEVHEVNSLIEMDQIWQLMYTVLRHIIFYCRCN